MLTLLHGLFTPFLGTVLGAACVFFLKQDLGVGLRRMFSGFAAGVMTAASVWSLLIPSVEKSAGWGVFCFVPPLVGLWLGFGFLLLPDRLAPQWEKTGLWVGVKENTGLFFAVTLHNLPEGMAIGVVLAGFLRGDSDISAATVGALALGIAFQNFPEGAVVSLPLRGEGMTRGKAFLFGALSGIVEPIGGLLTLWMAALIIPALPFLLSFAAGAMLFVVVEELIPARSTGSAVTTVFFGVGFSLMMLLDVALG